MWILRALRNYWDSIVALIAAVVGALWLSGSMISAVTTEIIAFFTIQAAVILPAMIFTAGVLRGQGLTLDELQRYQVALRKQMQFWVTLLFVDLLAVAFLIVGKAVNWEWQVTVWGYSADVSRLLIFCATFVGTLAVLRMVPFVRGVMSLMELNGWLVRKALEAESKPATPPTDLPPQAPLELPSGYGKILPHQRKRRATGG